MSLKALMTLLAGLVFSHALFAASSSLQIPRPYVIHLLDGRAVSVNRLTAPRQLELTPGEHQLVLRFEASYRERGESRLISGEPLVITLRAAEAGALRLDFKAPRSYDEAQHFLERQPVRLLDLKSQRPWPAQIFVLPKQAGLQIGRDYQAELLTLGKAFGQPAPQPSSHPSGAPGADAPPQVPPLNGNNAPTLERLKYWYNRADPPTRKQFQHWIRSQP